jgi:hypothetical protein
VVCLTQKAESAKQEKNRATVVALNAEIRRTKAKLLEEDLPKLQRLALKKVTALPAFPPFCIFVNVARSATSVSCELASGCLCIHQLPVAKFTWTLAA